MVPATMNMYWVYDLPSWLFAVLTVAVAVAIGLIGFYATRRWVRQVHGDEISHNDIVGFFLGTIGLFYGITLGLVAVGTWQTFSDVDTKLDLEASALAALYGDVSSFPEPKRSELQTDLREYTRRLIDVVWPLRRRGIVPPVCRKPEKPIGPVHRWRQRQYRAGRHTDYSSCAVHRKFSRGACRYGQQQRRHRSCGPGDAHLQVWNERAARQRLRLLFDAVVSGGCAFCNATAKWSSS